MTMPTAAEWERMRGCHPISDPNWTPPEPGCCWCGRPEVGDTTFCDIHPHPADMGSPDAARWHPDEHV